jgi:hypothetical protein
VGTALEAWNFKTNMDNGNHRKAASDLATTIGTGLAATAITAAFFAGVGPLAAMAIAGGIGMFLTPIASGITDWGFKQLGLTNQDERDLAQAQQGINQMKAVASS